MYLWLVWLTGTPLFKCMVSNIHGMLRVSNVFSKTWNNAEADCSSQGGYLTTMLSMEEMSDCYQQYFSTETKVLYILVIWNFASHFWSPTWPRIWLQIISFAWRMTPSLNFETVKPNVIHTMQEVLAILTGSQIV